MTDVHEHVSGLIAAYALGAVPEDEIPAIRAHILTCEDCFAEAESLADVATSLAETVEPVELAGGFTERVLAEARAPRERHAVKASRRWWVPSRTTALGAAALTVLALLAFGTTSYLGSVARQREYRDAVAALIHDPDALTLTGPGGAEAVLAATDEGSVLIAVDLGDAPAGREYQLWLMDEGEPVPAETFDAGSSVVIVRSRRSLTGYEAAAVTVEPEGGSEAPTTDPVLTSV